MSTDYFSYVIPTQAGIQTLLLHYTLHEIRMTLHARPSGLFLSISAFSLSEKEISLHQQKLPAQVSAHG